MAKVYKKLCYREVPNGADIQPAADGKKYAVWVHKGQRITAEYVETANGPRVKRESDVFIASYRDANGQARERSTKCRDRKAAENKLQQWLNEVEKIKGGILSEEEVEIGNNRNDLIETYIPPFEEFLEPRCKGRGYIKGIVGNIRRICGDCKFVRMRDLKAEPLIKWLNAQADKNMGARNRNVHRAAMIRFANWAVDSKRMPFNPFTRVPKAKEKLDKRHARRALTLEEIGKLLHAAETRPLHEITLIRRGDKKGQNLANIRDKIKDKAIRLGWERKLIYAALIYTGLRKSELKSIAMKQVRLDTRIPHLVLLNADSKNGDGGLLPIHPDFLPHLRDWMETKKKDGRLDPDEKLFKVCNSLCHVLTRDLKFAGIDKRDCLGQVVDVHALRHTHATVLQEQGAGLEVAKDSMRHSSIEMTLQYTHKKLESVAGAIARLPNFMDTTEQNNDAKAPVSQS